MKIIYVNNCEECPYYNTDLFIFYGCRKLNKVIEDEVIPENCPLPNAGEE